MTMEYLNFILSVAAVGLCFVFWHFYRSRSHAGGSIFSRPVSMGAKLEQAPPLKKTISGPSEKELEELAKQAQVEKWRRADPVQRAWLNRPSTDSLEGQKYTYIPSPKSCVPANQAAARNVIDINKYRLVG
ncbi:MAG: hypothetical protein HKN57_01455 [Xanthomonadales bacterium]|nr:hypothetical protein [Gammaproteobacteria bacterium]NND55896.1 hypothetical protein [Xanthomonadales bacterium]NNK50594.1 hypothetical protein [Xanthomonadales bacterium]